MTECGQEEPPVVVNDVGMRWVRTEIRKGADLVDGSQWIKEFHGRLVEAQRQAKPAGSRRLLRQTATDGDNPQYWGSIAGDTAPVVVRNEVLGQMRQLFGPDADCSRGPGRKVRLATGEEVIFWFNVGPPGQPRDRVYVTAAQCPHQGVCLNTGELRDIEDVAGVRRGMIRCPRHNKTFDLRTGESQGNSEMLTVYPCRFEHGHWYVAVGPATDAGMRAMLEGEGGEADTDMAVDTEPQCKRLRGTDDPMCTEPLQPQPPCMQKPVISHIRQLAHCATMD